MNTFEEKLEEFSIIFLRILKKFNEETPPPMPGVLDGPICLDDEFKKEDMNIKVAC